MCSHSCIFIDLFIQLFEYWVYSSDIKSLNIFSKLCIYKLCRNSVFLSIFITIPLLITLLITKLKKRKYYVREIFLNNLSKKTSSLPFLYIRLPSLLFDSSTFMFDSNERSNKVDRKMEKIRRDTHSNRWTKNKTAPGNTRSSLPTVHRLPNAIRLGIP